MLTVLPGAAAAPPPGAGRGFGAWPIRRKLQLMVLLPLVGVLPLLGLVLLIWGDAAVDRLLVTKARADLAIAQGYFERVRGEVAASTQAVAESQLLFESLQRTPPAATAASVPAGEAASRLRPLLLRIKAREGLDFINLRHPDGRLWVADTPAAAAAQPVAPPSEALRVQAALAVLAPAEQDLLSPELRLRVPVNLLATRNAQPSQRQVEDRALVLRALAPVRDAQGRTLALVQAGLLLNRNLPFIDHIN
ncbi:hypothetical protein [Aquabacterium sp. OR-4]|uniref:hypothetical protein n=1 Tax=Aquabacterium sp. OR-4 TaxID=2978127 RepID=UPI0021B3EFA9|nr:hypothetical protein [Aquabacterium sp. OR-4]MDT7836398.1 hypothetical protein [Aquabacterium sp. OR-4]